MSTMKKRVAFWCQGTMVKWGEGASCSQALSNEKKAIF